VSDDVDNYFKPIAKKDIDNWMPKPKGLYGKLFLKIVNTEGEAFEIDMDELQKGNVKAKPVNIVSAFYNWKKKNSIKTLLKNKNIDIKIVKKLDKVAIIKESIGNMPVARVIKT